MIKKDTNETYILMLVRVTTSLKATRVRESENFCASDLAKFVCHAVETNWSDQHHTKTN